MWEIGQETEIGDRCFGGDENIKLDNSITKQVKQKLIPVNDFFTKTTHYKTNESQKAQGV